MTKAEAKRIVCMGFAIHMDNGSTNEWLYQNDRNEDLSEEDCKRMVDAFNELVAELWRRSGQTSIRRPL
jgi:hypothetical protein